MLYGKTDSQVLDIVLYGKTDSQAIRLQGETKGSIWGMYINYHVHSTHRLSTL